MEPLLVALAIQTSHDFALFSLLTFTRTLQTIFDVSPFQCLPLLVSIDGTRMRGDRGEQSRERKQRAWKCGYITQISFYTMELNYIVFQ